MHDPRWEQPQAPCSEYALSHTSAAQVFSLLQNSMARPYYHTKQYYEEVLGHNPAQLPAGE